MEDTQHRTVPAAAPEAVARVHQSLTALPGLDGLPLAEHAEVYQRLHAELQQALAEIENPDTRPANGR